jgi:hypothetical protein
MDMDFASEVKAASSSAEVSKLCSILTTTSLHNAWTGRHGQCRGHTQPWEQRGQSACGGKAHRPLNFARFDSEQMPLPM